MKKDSEVDQTMNKMENKKPIKWKKTAFGVILVSLMFAGYTITNVYVNIQNAPEGTNFLKEPLKWIHAPMVLAANLTPGASTGGLVNIFTVNETDIPDYDSPILESAAYVYEHCDAAFEDADPDAPHEELEDTTPYESGFSIVVVYQFSQLQAYDGGAWNASRVDAWMNTTGMAVGGDAASQLMEKGNWYSEGADANTQRINFYLKDGDGGAGDGFQINIDSTYWANCSVYYKG